ncbi:MAG: hypothetical protein U9P50_00920 [Patescibacteria group bacterium]|nr:hypothetical protein [Patescibacteria group bacterium]
MTTTEQITTENVLETDIKALAMNSDFGKMVFENANKKLTKAQNWLEEAKDLEYDKLLEVGTDKNKIKSFIDQLITHLEWLRNFDIGTVPNAQAEHDNFEGRVDSYYNSVYQEMVMKYLPFLREEKRRQNPQEKELEAEVRKVSQLRTSLEKELEKVKTDTEKIRKTGKEVGSAKGTRATVGTGQHFGNEVMRYEKLAKIWLILAVIGYAIIIGILIWLGIKTFSYVENLIELSKNPEASYISSIWGVVVSKLVILATLWYGLSFIIKNYNVNSHLASINRHRATVAKTLEDFISAEQQQEKPRMSEMLQNATEAMFKNAPIGFISKTEKETGNPVLQIINGLMGANDK